MTNRMKIRRNDYFLPFREVVASYVRNGADGNHTEDWIFNAYWNGDFEPYARERKGERYPLIGRRWMLRALCDTKNHPGVVFLSKEVAEPDVIEGLVVDVRPEIVLPPSPEKWTPSQLEAAYKALAALSLMDIAAEAHAGFLCQFVSALELISVCVSLGEPLPPFWEHWTRLSEVSRAKSNVDALIKASDANVVYLAISSPLNSELTKEGLFEKVKSQSSTISRTLFDILWKEFASDKKRTGGRPKGTRNRN